MKTAIPMALSVLLLVVSSGWCAAEDYPWPKYEMKDFNTFAAYFEAMIPHVKTGHDPSRPKEALAHFGLRSVPELERYLTHDNLQVRYNAYGHLLTFLRLTNDHEARMQLFFSFLHGLEDKDEGIRQYVATRMNTFGASYFNKDSEGLILKQLKAGGANHHSFRHIILSAGMLQCREAIPTLRLIDSKDASAALARMGDDKALGLLLDEIPKKVRTEDIDVHLLHKMRRIAYTKQPGAIDFLVLYLHSDAVRPGGDDYPPTPIGEWAADLLSSILTNCPSDMAKCRDWMTKHYNRASLNQILGGEVRRWE